MNASDVPNENILSSHLRYKIYCSTLIVLLQKNLLVEVEAESHTVFPLILALNVQLIQRYKNAGEESKYKRMMQERDILLSIDRIFSKQLLSDSTALSKLVDDLNIQDETFSNSIERIHAETLRLDFFRRYIRRLQRVFIATLLFLDTSEGVAYYVSQVVGRLKDVLGVINLVFFIPRFCLNLFCLLKHLISGPWMGADEALMPWYERLSTYCLVDTKGLTLLSDAILLCGGVLAFFMLVGSLAATAVYLTIGLQITDFLISLSILLVEEHALNP